MTSLSQLQSQFAHLPQVQFRFCNELIAVDVTQRHATATVLLQGAQLIAYAPNDQQAVIWNSPLAGFRRGASSRGGIPVCWPWFGDALRNPPQVKTQLHGDTLPAHGFVRGMDWTLDDIAVDADETLSLRFSLVLDAGTNPAWPFSSRLVVTHRVGRTLSTTLCVENTDRRAFTFSCALHTYFSVGAIEQASISGFENCDYIDALDQWAQKNQQGVIVFDREVDRIYQQVPARCVIHDALWQRDIVVEAIGSRSAVVWNPWSEKSKRLSDFAPDAYRDMLCIETANVLDDCITLSPQTAHETGVVVSVRAHHV